MNVLEVKKDLQIYGTWDTVDIRVHCHCGNTLQFVDSEQQRRCKKCKQLWLVLVHSIPIEIAPQSDIREVKNDPGPLA